MTCCGPKPTPGEYKFNADYRVKPLTNKFWSKFDNLTGSIDYSKIKRYEEEFEKRRKYDARCHSKMPRYTNQTYGWLPGYKIRFLQNCNLRIARNSSNQRVAKDLLQQHFKGQMLLNDHCACKELLNTYI